MNFGGHETFPLREGWLHKGMRLLFENPDLLSDEYHADWLGVGRNMGRSIRYWLVATELATPADGKALGRHTLLGPTEIGELVWQQDPYFTDLSTWWMVHINLINNERCAYAWSWFFNVYAQERFERPVCIQALRQHLQLLRKRVPSERTLERDIACLLACYARPIPMIQTDPEDVRTSPLTELELITHLKSSGTYQVATNPKLLSPHLLGYCLAKGLMATTKELPTTKYIEKPVIEIAREPYGLGRTFCLGSESLFDTLLNAEQIDSSAIALTGLAGERRLRALNQSPIEWLTAMYASCGQEASDAA